MFMSSSFGFLVVHPQHRFAQFLEVITIICYVWSPCTVILLYFSNVEIIKNQNVGKFMNVNMNKMKRVNY